MDIFIRDSSGIERCLERGDCMFHALGLGYDSFSAALHVEQLADEETSLPRVVMQAMKEETGESGEVVPVLGHAKRCPAMEMQQQAIPVQSDPARPNQKVAVACCVVLERKDPKTGMPQVLVTRRHPLMRAFPFIWVFPGGHVDPHEQLWQAGLRELKEETGIEVSAARDALHLLGFWESIYPSRLEVGPLRKQHLVAFFHYRLPDDLSEVDVKFCPVEVDAAAWISAGAAAEVLESFATRDTAPLDERATLELAKRAKEVFGHSDCHSFHGKALSEAAGSHAENFVEQWDDREFSVEESLTGVNVDIGVERMSTATVFMLSLWLTLALKRECSRSVGHSLL